ncbi:hypothetical protein TNCV_4171071 [Trichonephila clavipes]|nr:hypothetical protein TNCV_4171071 [Trichonephila clavipes]
MVSEADCCAVGPGFESRRKHGCLQVYSAFAAGGTLNSRRAASSLVRGRTELKIVLPLGFCSRLQPMTGTHLEDLFVSGSDNFLSSLREGQDNNNNAVSI